MANSLTVSASVNYSVNGATAVARSLSKTIVISATPMIDNIQTVPTSDTAIVLGSVAAPGYVLLENKDSTNYIEIGVLTTDYNIKLLAGQFALVPIDGTTLFAKANTASVNLQVTAISL